MTHAAYLTLEYVGIAALLIVNAAAVLLVAMQLPGTWLMLILTGLVAWWQWGLISPWTLGVLTMIAVSGELVELLASSRGATKAGGSRRAALGALVGGVVGALAGTVLLPVPILGTIVGACLGAGIGSLLGDCWAGRTWSQALCVGRGAAWGRLWGTAAKIAIAAVMWLVIAAAVFWP